MGLIDDLPPIPDKLSYKIGDVARLVGVEPHVLRYWETEFPRLKPRKSPTGHRLYSRTEIERLRRVRCLLHERGFTLAGARALLREGEEAVSAALAHRPSEVSQAAQDGRVRLDAVATELETATGQLSDAVARAQHAEQAADFWRKAAQRAEAHLAVVVSAVEESTRRTLGMHQGD
jgi:DNA-binding transcriptional MerR regulator